MHVWIYNLLIVSHMHSRAVVRLGDCPYMTFSFRVVCISMHKMGYRKEPMTCVSSHNLPVLACVQL